MNDPVVIFPYLFIEETQQLVERLNNTFIEYICEEDKDRIGPDMMYQKLWKKTNKDVIILHSDMLPLEEDVENQWYSDLCLAAEDYPEAGILGTKLLYPAKHQDKYIIQHAGGKFTDGIPDHFGSGLDLFTNHTAKSLELDEGQYDHVREVAWVTFGGIYIRRSVIDAVGDFDPSFEWSYNRDVDYCLTTRKKGFKIYQTPISLLHFESKDVKRIRTQEMIDKESRNLTKLGQKWGNTEFYKTLDKKVN